MGFTFGDLFDYTPVGFISKNVFQHDLGHDIDKALDKVGIHDIPLGIVTDIENIVGETVGMVEDVGEDIFNGVKNVAVGLVKTVEGLEKDVAGIAETAVGVGQLVLSGGTHHDILDAGVNLTKKGLHDTLKGVGQTFEGIEELTVKPITDVVVDSLQITLNAAALAADLTGAGDEAGGLREAGNWVHDNETFRKGIEIGVDIALIVATGGAAAPELMAVETAAEAGKLAAMSTEVALEAGEAAEAAAEASKAAKAAGKMVEAEQAAAEAAKAEQASAEAEQAAESATKLQTKLKESEKILAKDAEQFGETAESQRSEAKALENLEKKDMPKSAKLNAKKAIKKMAREGATNDLLGKGIDAALQLYLNSLPYPKKQEPPPEKSNKNMWIIAIISIIAIILLGFGIYYMM